MNDAADQMRRALELVHASLIMRKAAEHMPHEMRVIEAALESYREHQARMDAALRALDGAGWTDAADAQES